MKNIHWTCEAKAGWLWKSGSPGHPGFPVVNDSKREGTISLPPNADYWYPCIELILDNGSHAGNAYLRYFKVDGKDKIQAITVAQGVWEADGDVGESFSVVDPAGGIKLLARFVS